MAVQTGSSIVGMVALWGLTGLISPRWPEKAFNNDTLIEPQFSEYGDIVNMEFVVGTSYWLITLAAILGVIMLVMIASNCQFPPLHQELEEASQDGEQVQQGHAQDLSN